MNGTISGTSATAAFCIGGGAGAEADIVGGAAALKLAPGLAPARHMRRHRARPMPKPAKRRF
jgi:hypothetical protein